MTRGMRGAGRLQGLTAIRKVIRSGGNPIGEPSSVLIRRDAAIAAGCFRTDSPYVIDVDMWIRMLSLGDLYVLPQVLSEYRVSGGSWSVDAAHRQSSDYRDLVNYVRSSARYGVTWADARLGVIRGAMNARLRRLFYALFVREGGGVS